MMKPRRAAKLVKANWVSDFLGSGENHAVWRKRRGLKFDFDCRWMHCSGVSALLSVQL